MLSSFLLKHWKGVVILLAKTLRGKVGSPVTGQDEFFDREIELAQVITTGISKSPKMAGSFVPSF